MQKQFNELIGRAYRAMVMKEGNLTALFREFERLAADDEFRVYAAMQRDHMKKVAQRDFVSNIGAQFVDRAFAAMERHHAID